MAVCGQKLLVWRIRMTKAVLTFVMLRSGGCAEWHGQAWAGLYLQRAARERTYRSADETMALLPTATP